MASYSNDISFMWNQKYLICNYNIITSINMVKRTKKSTKPKATSSSYEDNIKFVENVYKRLNIDPNTIQPTTPNQTQLHTINDDNNIKQCTICY